MDENELQLLAEGLGKLILAGMGSRSRWALRAALDAANTEGVGGVLHVKIPTTSKDRCDAGFKVDEDDWLRGR